MKDLIELISKNNNAILEANNKLIDLTKDMVEEIKKLRKREAELEAAKGKMGWSDGDN